MANGLRKYGLAVGLAVMLGSLGILASPSPATAEEHAIDVGDDRPSGPYGAERQGYRDLYPTAGGQRSLLQESDLALETTKQQLRIRVVDIYGTLYWLVAESRLWGFEAP